MSNSDIEPTSRDEPAEPISRSSNRRSPRFWMATSLAVVASASVIIGGVLVSRGNSNRTIAASANQNVPSEANSETSSANSNDRTAEQALENWIVQTSSIAAVPEGPTPRPTYYPTRWPTPRPTFRIVPKPTRKPISPQPTMMPTKNPTPLPTSTPSHDRTASNSANSNCFTSSLYDEIDSDISLLKFTISNHIERSHFLGGIVRLAAHDFMDYNRFSSVPYGPDGCFDPDHEANMGLPQSVWCTSCLLRGLYEAKYQHISRADFWIASANAVIRQTSLNNTLDLKETFTWGRVDTESCPGSGNRVPSPNRCSEVEDTFLGRMGLEWADAVALLGAHSIGRGSADNSGHEGVWVDNADDAMVFDKQYYEELFNNAWHPRNMGQSVQDWTLDVVDPENPRMMLNTDLCLVYDIESVNNNCCTREGECTTYRARQCPIYSEQDSRRQAANAVVNYIGGSMDSTNNEPFYTAFTAAWVKATNLGWDNLSALDTCNDGSLFN
ncbi:hypothetical protein ACHAWX_003515 [Stephanocyclus meneghinianus]